MMILTTTTAEETQHFARFCAENLDGGTAIALNGDLGAGKTCFTQGFMSGLGVDGSEVSSPTFAIIHEYDGEYPVLHMDLYRLEVHDLPNLGLEERIDDHLEYRRGIVLVEWSNKHPTVLPVNALQVDIGIVNAKTRELSISGPDVLVQKLQQAWNLL